MHQILAVDRWLCGLLEMAWLQAQISTGADLQDFDNQTKAKINVNVIVDRTKPIHDTITKNSFKSPKWKVKSKASQQLVVQRNNTSLFGHPYIANQQCEGDPAIFFSHENQSSPPSLSEFGKIQLGQKSVLLSCSDFSNQPPHPEFDSKVFDGAAVVHFLPTSTANMLITSLPFLLQQL